MKRHQLMNERLKTLELHCSSRSSLPLTARFTLQAVYGFVVYVVMRIPWNLWCLRRTRPTGYEHQSETAADEQQQQQQHDVISQYSESKLANNDLSQQIVIDSNEVCQ